jgi:transposase InsO family protein
MSGQHVKVFWSDNGRNFINHAFIKHLEETGVQCQHSAPYAHQQNDKAERVMHMIKGRMYAMLDFTHLPPSLWGETALTMCYLFNCTES